MLEPGKCYVTVKVFVDGPMGELASWKDAIARARAPEGCADPKQYGWILIRDDDRDDIDRALVNEMGLPAGSDLAGELPKGVSVQVAR